MRRHVAPVLVMIQVASGCMLRILSLILSSLCSPSLSVILFCSLSLFLAQWMITAPFHGELLGSLRPWTCQIIALCCQSRLTVDYWYYQYKEKPASILCCSNGAMELSLESMNILTLLESIFKVRHFLIWLLDFSNYLGIIDLHLKWNRQGVFEEWFLSPTHTLCVLSLFLSVSIYLSQGHSSQVFGVGVCACACVQMCELPPLSL